MSTQTEITPRGRLIEVAEWLEAGAPHKDGSAGFGMRWYEENTSCGTIHCIAGALIQFEAARCGFSYTEFKRSEHEGTLAAELIGVRYSEAKPLFNPTYLDADYWHTITPAKAAATIRHYLDTGVVDWEHSKPTMDRVMA